MFAASILVVVGGVDTDTNASTDAYTNTSAARFSVSNSCGKYQASAVECYTVNYCCWRSISRSSNIKTTEVKSNQIR